MRNRLFIARTLLLAALVAVVPFAGGSAGDAHGPDANDMVRSLAPITYLPEHGGPPRRAVELAVEFEFGSARLTGPARRLLDRLGTALRDERLRASRFEIVGHTDAVGDRAANQTLSERRARAVLAYLAESHGIDRSRLVATGKGEDALKDPLDPMSGVNRRVEIVNLTPVWPAAPDPVEQKARDILTGK